MADEANRVQPPNSRMNLTALRAARYPGRWVLHGHSQDLFQNV